MDVLLRDIKMDVQDIISGICYRPRHTCTHDIVERLLEKEGSWQAWRDMEHEEERRIAYGSEIASYIRGFTMNYVPKSYYHRAYKRFLSAHGESVKKSTIKSTLNYLQSCLKAYYRSLRERAGISQRRFDSYVSV